MKSKRNIVSAKACIEKRGREGVCERETERERNIVSAKVCIVERDRVCERETVCVCVCLHVCV